MRPLPSFGGLFTSSLSEAPLLCESDLVLAVGVDPVEPLPRPFQYEMPVVEINPWAHPRRFFPGEAEVDGPPGPILESVSAELAENTWTPGAGQQAWKKARQSLWEAGPGFTPHQVVEASWRLDRPGGRSDRYRRRRGPLSGGHAFLDLHPTQAGIDLQRPLHHGIRPPPPALGAALARPGRPSVCLTGDGGLGIPLAELETLARTGAEVVVVVLNDAALTLIELKQVPGQGGKEAVRYLPTDFAEVARLGDRRCGRREPIPVGRGFGRTRPRLVDARIDPTAYRAVIQAARG